MALGELVQQVEQESGPSTDSMVSSYVAGGGSSQSSGGPAMVAGGGYAPAPVATPYQQGPQGGWQPGTMPSSRLPQTIASMYQPDIASQQAQQQGLLDRLGLNQADMTNQRNNLQQNHGLDMRGIGLDERSLGIDRGAAARAIQNTIEQERLAKGMTANQKRQIGITYEGDVRGANEDAATRGAFTTEGHRSTRKDLFGNLMLGNERLDLGLEQDLLGIREQRSSAKDRQSSLDVEADRLGLRRDQLNSQLNQGLANLGIQNMLSANDIFNALSGGNAQMAAIARQIMDDVIRYGGQ